MKKIHNIKEGDKGFYDNKPCIVTNIFKDGLIITIKGKFGSNVQWIKIYESKFHKFFGIGKDKLVLVFYEKELDISYYYFKSDE